MRILFPLNAFYPSQIGGPCNTLYWHCSGLYNNGIKPTVITTRIGIKDQINFNDWKKLKCGLDHYLSKASIFAFSSES